MDELVPSQPSHHTPGTPWDDATREAAYQLYRTSGRGSLKRTAELAGVPFKTVAHWSVTDSWQMRLAADDAEDRTIVRRSVDAALAAYAEAAVHALQAVVESGQNEMARVRAAELLLGLAGHVAPRTSNVRVTQELPSVPPATLAELQAMSPRELAERQRLRAIEAASQS